MNTDTMARSASWERQTRETRIEASLNLDGRGACTIETPLGMWTHLLESFAFHGRFDLDLKAEGDTHVDGHHLVEDCGLVLGELFNRALGGRQDLVRAGCFLMPMDEALAQTAVDLGGRPFLQYRASFSRPFAGELELDLLEDFWRAFADRARANLVLLLLEGRSDHHRAEVLFKAMGRALAQACRVLPQGGVSSIKEVVS